MKIQTQPLVKRQLLASALLSSLLVSSCTDGIDRDIDTSGSNAGGGGSTVLNDDTPADPSYVELDLVDFTSEQPSVVSVLFQARDKNNIPIESLTASDFQIKEDDEPLPANESASELIGREFLPYVLDTMVMLDISSSIRISDLANMKQAVNELIRDPATGNSRLFSGQRVAIYAFNDSVMRIKDFSTSPAHIVNALEAITLPISITPTDLYGAVEFAINLWQPGESINNIHDGVVILITDGTDTAGRSTLSDTLSAIDNKKVITIGVGEDINEDVLEQIGTAGSFSIESFAELSPVLSGIRESLRRYANSYYHLQYASPKRAAEGKVGNSDHEFEVSVINNDNSGKSGRVTGEFNSFDFSNVTPRVVIGGLKQMEPGQRATYIADTFWEIQTPSYAWQLGGDCSLESNNGSTISISATNTGSCQLSVVDNANGGVISNTSVNIIGD